eukprot:scaffold6618_cov253-Amphora_coffeaeformis.AAC.1
MMTSDEEWNPSILDFSNEDSDEQWFDALEHHEEHPYHNLSDEFGNYRRRVVAQLCQTLQRPTTDPFEELIDRCTLHSLQEVDELPFLDAFAHEVEASPKPRIVTSREPDYQSLRPHFGWISVDSIKKTFQNTTQLARATAGTLLKKVYKSQNPALNVIHRNEPVATDELY